MRKALICPGCARAVTQQVPPTYLPVWLFCRRCMPAPARVRFYHTVRWMEAHHREAA